MVYVYEIDPAKRQRLARRNASRECAAKEAHCGDLQRFEMNLRSVLSVNGMRDTSRGRMMLRAESGC